MKIEKGCIHWFIHHVNLTPLGFIRLRQGGALVIGGKTGSHFTEHGESYWEKFKEIISLGYIPAEIAEEFKLVQPRWSPPEISSPTEREWIEKIKRNEM